MRGKKNPASENPAGPQSRAAPAFHSPPISHRPTKLRGSHLAANPKRLAAKQARASPSDKTDSADKNPIRHIGIRWHEIHQTRQLVAGSPKATAAQGNSRLGRVSLCCMKAQPYRAHASRVTSFHAACAAARASLSGCRRKGSGSLSASKSPKKSCPDSNIKSQASGATASRRLSLRRFIGMSGPFIAG